ncbi:Hypothetical protein A7982_06032 [Minicystis rosea]|nr:Hypothetical protein A7982_06032 [Minicystis rosea]
MTSAPLNPNEEGPAPSGDDGRGAREQADRIAALLDEVQATVEPPTWQRVEALVEALVGLYGQGIERLLAIVASPEARAERLDALLCEDELVSSLLVLHGLHPVSTAARIEHALERARPHLGAHGVEISLVGVGADGVARLRLSGAHRGCASSLDSLERTLEAAIEAVAPEVKRVELDSPMRSGAERLVQIDLRRSRARGEGAR